MCKRFVIIRFCHLTTDWMVRRRPQLKDVPFVLACPERNRMVIKAVSRVAALNGISTGTVVADARAVFPGLEVYDDQPQLAEQLLKGLGQWCIRYTPYVAIHMPDSLILDASGCPHLWGGEQQYINDIIRRLHAFGYYVHICIADTIGAAWAMCHFGTEQITTIETGRQLDALLPLCPAALRLDETIVDKLERLGFARIGMFIHLPPKSLRRRFGQNILKRIGHALGTIPEPIEPLCPPAPYIERLPCLEPIRTATAIEIALKKLLEGICNRLEREAKGLRECTLKTYRVDGREQRIVIGTSRPSRNIHHLLKLFEEKKKMIAPGLGIEVFTLEAGIVEDLAGTQESFWNTGTGEQPVLIAELIDRIVGRIGRHIHRYIPQEHHWPERSFKTAISLDEQPAVEWPTECPRPLHLLETPARIEVTVRMPDYPPMLFRYQGNLHRIKKADGPERVEQEWWLKDGEHRDYYCVEDEEGGRYWLFRMGHYGDNDPKWYLHGFFA